MSTDSFGARSELEVGERRFEIYRLDALRRASTPAGCRTP